MVTVGIQGSLAYGASNQAYSEELSAPEKALSFLRDVVRLDMTKYDVKQVRNLDYPSDLTGLAQERVIITLESGESKLDVICGFRKNALSDCTLYVLEGSPLFAQPSTNVLDAAKGFLDRHLTYSGASYLQTMRDMLDSVNETKTVTTTSGNVKLEVSIEGDDASIYWIYTVNGLDIDRNNIRLSFRYGSFESFRDDWNLYKVGSTDVNVSEEEAIEIAMSRAKNHSWRVWVGEWIEVKDFNIVKEHIKIKLGFGEKEPFILYPYWHILLPLDKVYPGYVTCISVALWADTAEIAYCQELGGGGEPPTDDPTGQTSVDPTPLLIAVPVVVAIMLGVAFYRRKKICTSGKAENNS